MVLFTQFLLERSSQRTEMFRKRAQMIGIALVLICLFSGDAWGGDLGQLRFPEKDADELTLYLRKSSGNRFLDPVPGEQAISENVYGALAVWGGYYVERTFTLSSLTLQLHFDVYVVSEQASSRIEIDIRRNGSIVYTTDVYELPPGHSGSHQVDILADVMVYPVVDFNQGDELGFHFYQILNLSPCQFRYNGETGRNDSRLTVELQRPDFGIVEFTPAVFDISLEPGASCGTILVLTNGGGKYVRYDLCLPQEQENLRYDDSEPAQWWSLSDQYGQDLFNVRFTPAQAGTLTSAQFLLSEEGTSGTPDLMVYIWDDDGGFPGAKLDSALVPHDSLLFYPGWQDADLADRGLVLQAHNDFHIGYTLRSHSPGDSLALCSDDGLPVGNQRRSSELWGENWKTIYRRHGIDANFMIQAAVNYGAQPDWISIEPNSGYLFTMDVDEIELHLDAAGLNDGTYRTCVVIDNDSADRLIPVPITLRVGQTPVEESTAKGSLPRSFLSVNYPNPFNASTRIAYRVGSPGSGGELAHVRLAVHNILGQLVRELVDEPQGAGSYSVWWDGRDERGMDVASGVYLCRLQVGDIRQTSKMLLIR